ncbi:hypothetical protein ESCO_004441 [Escovopsis weberi]|uniref:Uncharacterized protein n=1 Tax=Escovopsis weberi TaxID=150374 RepID=A0A0M9VVC2_ESCWE|nr:hypothetical protein ESCO_004441 [Escovopsis weberi]
MDTATERSYDDIQDSVDTGISALESAFKEAQAQHQKDMASANAKLDQVMAIFLEYVKHSKGALADLEASLASIRADVRNAQASMANVQASVANAQASMTNIQAGVASVQVNMAQVAQRIERLEGATHRIEDDIRDTRQSTPSVCSNTADVRALMMLRALPLRAPAP